MFLKKKEEKLQKEIKDTKEYIAVGSGLLVGFVAGSISTAIVFTVFKGLIK